jgi:hypothetical protein
VFGVPIGSIRRMCASSRARGRCSTPPGTTNRVALPQLHGAIAELDLELALEHEEEVVSLWMAVPDELALDLHHLDLVVVHRRHDARRETLLEERAPTRPQR